MSITDAEIDAIFNAYDADNSGNITPDELILLIKDLKPAQKKYNVRNLMKLWDPNGDHKVDKAEFSAKMKKVAEKHPEWISSIKTKVPALVANAEADSVDDFFLVNPGLMADELAGEVANTASELFDLYDTDNNGYLDEAEVELVLQALKPSQAKFDKEKYMKVWDKDGNNKVEREEFVQRVADLAADSRIGNFEDVLIRLKKKAYAAKHRQFTVDAATEITAAQSAAIFDAYDTNGNGELDDAELLILLKDLRPKKENFDLKTIYPEWDADGNGKIVKEEVHAKLQKIAGENKEWLANIKQASLDLLKTQNKMIALNSLAHELFQSYDVDGNGYLDEHEVEIVVRALKPEQDKFDRAAIMKAWDKDSNAQVGEEEFVQRCAEIVARAKDRHAVLANLKKKAEVASQRKAARKSAVTSLETLNQRVTQSPGVLYALGAACVGVGVYFFVKRRYAN
jgi:Ca2+-binding EF-hand superfamily protein